jgi:hypothetical protein
VFCFVNTSQVKARAADGDGLALSLPPRLDAAWHAALLSTRGYAALCSELLGCAMVHHDPATAGDPLEAKRARVAALRAAYAQVFAGRVPGETGWWAREGDGAGLSGGGIAARGGGSGARGGRARGGGAGATVADGDDSDGGDGDDSDGDGNGSDGTGDGSDGDGDGRDGDSDGRDGDAGARDRGADGIDGDADSGDSDGDGSGGDGGNNSTSGSGRKNRSGGENRNRRKNRNRTGNSNSSRTSNPTGTTATATPTATATAKAVPAAAAEVQSILLRVRESVYDGKTVEFKIRTSTKLGTLMRGVWRQFSLDPRNHYLIFDGVRIERDKTVVSYGMQDGDVIDISVNMTGC